MQTVVHNSERQEARTATSAYPKGWVSRFAYTLVKV